MSIEEKIEKIKWRLLSNYSLVRQHEGSQPLAVVSQREFNETISAILDIIEEIQSSTQTAKREVEA